MTRYLLMTLLLLATFATSAQSNIKTTPTPSWITPVEYKRSPSDTVGAGGYYYLLSEWQEHFEKQEAYYRVAVKILTTNGLSGASSIEINYDPSYQQLYFHQLIIHRDGKELNILPTSKFEILRREANMDRQIYDKSLDAMLNVEDVQVNDIIEYSYSLKGYNPVFNNRAIHNIRLTFGVPIGKSVDRIVCSKSRKLDFRPFNNAREPVHEDVGEQLDGYTWVAENVPALRVEDNVPDWHRVHDIVEVSEFHSWSDVNEWALVLYTQQPVDEKAIDSKVKEMRSRESSLEKQIQAAIRFVQDEVRYLSFSDGIQGYRPHDPSAILRQRFGDCKDKSLLLATILRKLGVEAHPALVHSSAGKRLEKSLPSPYAFDHCITQFVFNDTTYWCDPTYSLERGSFKTSQGAGYHKALVIAPGTAGLSDINVSKAVSSVRTYETYSFKNVGGLATLTVKTTYTGARANSIRSYFKSKDKDEVRRSFTNFYANDYPEISMVDYVEYTDNETDNIIESTERYEIENFWTRDSTTGIQQTEFYARIVAGYFDRPSTKKRTSPFAIEHPVSITQTIIIELPEEWSVESSTAEVISPAFRFAIEINYVDQKVVLRYAYESRRDHVAAEEAIRYVKDCDRALNELSFRLTYGAADNNKTTAFNTPFLLIGIFFLPFVIMGLIALYRYDPRSRTYEVSYEGFGGWLVLPVIGIFLTPVFTLINFSDNEYFNYLHWEILTNPSHGQFNPKLGVLVLIEYLFEITFLAFTIFLIILMVKRRTSFPLFATIMYGSTVAFLVVDSIWLNSMGMATAFDGESAKASVRAIMAALIWIPYINYADRVKGTFTRRLRQ